MIINVDKIRNKINVIICNLFGHRRVIVHEQRIRYRNKHNKRINRRKGGGKKLNVAYVDGYYFKCSRCGRKLSRFRRDYN